MRTENTRAVQAGSDRRIATHVYFLAAFLIALATVSLVLIGHVASQKANQQALATELRLFKSALEGRQVLIARDQLSVARWDVAVENISKEFDRDFVRDVVVDSLWYDFGLDRTYLVAADDTILALADRSDVSFKRHVLPPDSALRQLVARTRARFMGNRVQIEGGYTQKYVSTSHVMEVAEFGFERIDQKPAFLSAMAIVPDDGETALDGGLPVVLISARFVDPALIADLNARLTFNQMDFTAEKHDHAGSSSQVLSNMSGDVIGTFLWTSATPGQKIWSIVVPIILMLGLLLGLAAFTVSRKIGRLSSSLEESERVNRHNAQHDALTGLANRLHFSEVLAYAVDQLPRRQFALIGCDLDRFKSVNDTYGHAAGDIVICQVARRLQSTVGRNGTVGRIGGDEFVIMIDGDVDHASLNDLAQRILASVRAPIDIGDGRSTDVGISLGVAVAPQCGATEVQIFATADSALYVAKDNGRDQVVFGAGDASQESATISLERNAPQHAA